jgi:hypothetical protein
VWLPIPQIGGLSFLDGVLEAKAAIPSDVSILLVCSCYYDVGSDVMVEQGGCIIQEYAHMTDGRWYILY